MGNPTNRHDIKSTRIERPSFADLPSVDELVRLAELEEWLIVQVPTAVTVGKDGKRSDETKLLRERYVRELAVLLPAHKVWDSGFLPNQASLAAAKHKTAACQIAGLARFSIRKVVTDQALEDHLDLLTSAATEYRDIANALMHRLAGQLSVDVTRFAAQTLWHDQEQSGRLQPEEGDGEWRYFFHGVDCAFTSLTTGLTVEARLGYGENFGVFDPGFFMNFIHSSLPHRPDYQPIANILRDWWENARLALEFMERRGVLLLVHMGGEVGRGWVIASATTEDQRQVLYSHSDAVYSPE